MDTGPLRTGVIVVGAGFGGIAAALALRREGIDDFVVIERASSAGGTWRDNTYPGVACDVPAPLYGLASHLWPAWSRRFAPGPEIRAYLDRVIDTEGLRGHLRVGHELASARWTDGGWSVGIRRGAPGPPTLQLRAAHLVLACGRLTEPRIPEIPGLGTFPGQVAHTSRWRDDIAIDGHRVGVVGTGASGIQVAPELARRGAEVTLFQRSPAWILPRGDRAFTATERRAWRRDPTTLRELRETLVTEGEALFDSRSGGSAASDAARAALAHLHAAVADPELRAALTPGYAFGCKRVLLSDDFYPAIGAGLVRLEPSALESVDGRVLTSARGGRHAVDTLVLATGFQTTRQPFARLITGEGGSVLDAHWAGGMDAVGSTLVAGFPNLFVLGGPNAALGHNSSVLLLEAQAGFAAELIAHASAPIRVGRAAEDEARQEVDARAAGTPWLRGGCRNWYVDERSNRLTLLWPGTVTAFIDRLDRLRDAIRDDDSRRQSTTAGARPAVDATGR